MSGDTPAWSLDCPGCGAEVFTRAVATWYTDEEEHCPGCGSRVMVALDEDAADPDLLTARVYEYESGGDVVARLLVEVERLAEESKQRLACMGEYSALTDGLTRELDVERSKVEQLATKRDALEGLLAAAMVDDREAEHRAEVEQLTEDETERVQDARHAMRLARIDRGVVEAEVERLTSALAVAQAMTAERDRLLAAEREASARVAEGFEQLTGERDEARREVCRHRARSGRQAFGSDAANTRAMAIAAGLGWSCFEGGGS